MTAQTIRTNSQEPVRELAALRAGKGDDWSPAPVRRAPGAAGPLHGEDRGIAASTESARRAGRWSRDAAAAVALLACVACGRDPGRDVRPMTNPLASEAAPSASLEIIPLEDVRKSQAAAVAQRVANTEIVVTYSRPVARGRDLFGALVPYGSVWNPGADQATAIAVTRDIEVNGQALSAGKYSLWGIPGPDRWMVIFSRAADVYHTPYPGEAQDVLRLEVTPRQGPHAELLTFSFPMVDGKDAELQLHWGEVQVPLAIRVP